MSKLCQAKTSARHYFNEYYPVLILFGIVLGVWFFGFVVPSHGASAQIQLPAIQVPSFNLAPPTLISPPTKPIVPPSSPTPAPVAKPAQVQQVPVFLSAVAKTGYVETLTWSAPIKNPVGYEIDYNVNEDGWNVFVTNTYSVLTTYTTHPLSSGASYQWRIEAIDAIGGTTGVGTLSSKVVAGDVPSQVTGLVLNTTSTNTIQLTWPASSANGYAITGYEVDRSFDGIHWKVVSASVSPTALAFTDNQITNSIQYYYRVSAINALGNGSPSKIISSSLIPYHSTTTTLSNLPSQISSNYIPANVNYSYLPSGFTTLDKSRLIGIQLAQGCLTAFEHNRPTNCISYDKVAFLDNTNPNWSGQWTSIPYFHRLPPQIKNAYNFYDSPYVVMVDPSGDFSTKAKMIYVTADNYTYANPDEVISAHLRTEIYNRSVVNCETATVAPIISLIADTVTYMENGCQNSSINMTQTIATPNYVIDYENATAIKNEKELAQIKKTIATHNCINTNCPTVDHRWGK